MLIIHGGQLAPKEGHAQHDPRPMDHTINGGSPRHFTWHGEQVAYQGLR